MVRFGSFGAAVPLRLAVLEGPCLVRSWRAKVLPSRARLCHGPAQPQLSLAESSLAVGLPTPASEVQPSPAHTQLSPLSSAQPRRAQPSPRVGVGLAESCARRPIFGRRNAPFLVCFWLVWGRRAAAFPCFGGSWSVFGRLGPPCRCVSLS